MALDKAARAKLRQDIGKRTEGMGRAFEDQRKACLEVSKFAQPRISRFLRNGGTMASPLAASGGRNAASDAINSKLSDGHGIWAAGVIANGMSTGMADPSMPWFKLATEDDDLMEYQPVKEWVAKVESLMYAFFAKTNFYVAMKSGYLQLGCFGMSGTLMAEHPEHQAVNHSLVAGEFFIGLDDGLTSNTMLRRCDMTTIQIVQRFAPKIGLDNLPDSVRGQYNNSQYGVAHACWQLIEPNGQREWDRLDNLNMPYRSIYWMGNCEDDLLSVSGFDERPFWAPRWEVAGGDVYGTSPMMDALPDLRELQMQTLRKRQATDYAVRPALVGPPQLATVYGSLLPGSMTALANVDQGNMRPVWETRADAVSLIREDISEIKQAINRLTYVDLFFAITNMPGVQPRTVEEVARKNDEALRQLGPAIDRNQNEQLKVAIDRAFGILNRMGILPEAPKELHGKPLKVIFIGLLAQMQKAIGVAPIERTLGFVGNLAAVHPEITDKIDFDQAVDEYADKVGAPPSMIRSDDKVAAMRQARAQQQAAASAAAAMAPVKDGADAAKLLSETDAGNGQSILASLTGAR